MPKPKIDLPTTPSMKRVAAELNKKFGVNTLATPLTSEIVAGTRVKTGITTLDDAIGGGFPLGRLVEIYGLPSAGKSLIALKTVAATQQMGLEAVYIDAEDTFDPIWATKCGVDVKNLYVAPVSVGEEIFEIIRSSLKAEPGVIIVDSVAGMTTKKELEGDMDAITVAEKARLFSKAIPIINALNNKTLIIFINQLRTLIGGFYSGNTTPGGRALPYYASIRLNVKREKEPLTGETKKDIIGHIVQFNVDKNKTAPPSKFGSFKFYYDEARIE